MAKSRAGNARYVLTHYCAQQHRTVLIVYPLILQTIIIAQMLHTKREVFWKLTLSTTDFKKFDLTNYL